MEFEDGLNLNICFQAKLYRKGNQRVNEGRLFNFLHVEFDKNKSSNPEQKAKMTLY